MAKGGSRVSGNRELNWTANMDISQAMKNAEKLELKYKDLARLAANSVTGGNSTPISAPITAYRQAQLQMQEALRNSRLETERLKQEQIQLKNALQQGKVTQQDFRNETARLRAEQATLTAATRQARASQTAASGSYREAQTRLRELGMEIRNTTGGLSGMGVVQQARIREYNELNSSLKRFDATLGNHQRNVGNYPTILNGVTSGLIGLTAGFTSAAAILTSSFDTALKTDSIKTALEFTFGSVDIAAQKLDMLRKMANRLGIDYIALADSYRSFAGAAVASNYPLKEAERVFNAVSNAGAKLRLTSDQVKGALLALQQMISKGNVQAEELRGQLGERLPGAFSIAARAMGVTEVELNKMLKAGTVLAADLLPKLATELDKTFGNDQIQKIDALSSSWSRLKNSFSEIVEEQGAVSGFFNLLITLAGYAAAEIAGMSKALGTMFQLVTNGKGFLRNSTKQARAAGFTAIQEKAGKDAKSVVGSSKSQSALIKAINDEVAAGIEAQKVYTEAEKNYQNTREKNRTLSLTKDLQSKKATLDYQREFVSSLKAIYKEQFQPDVIKEISDAELKSVKAIQKRINDLKKLDGSADIGSEVYSRIEKLQERLAKPKKTNNDTELTAQRSLQKKIDENHKDATRKQLTSDQEQIQSIKDKYIAFQKEIDAFYNNPKNKGKVNTSTLKVDEALELANAEAEQEISRTKITIDAKKQLYDQYESYRSAAGKEAADKRFADDLGQYKTYVEYLDSLLPDEKDQSAKANKMRDLVKNLKPAAESDAKKRQQQELSELLLELRGYEEERLAIQQSYAEKRAQLTKDSDIANLNFREKEELDSLDDTNVKKLDAYKALYEGIDRLSDDAAKKVVGDAQEMLDGLVKAGLISKEFAKEIGLRLVDTTDALTDRMPVRLKDIAQSLGAVASQVGGIDEGFGNMIGTLANVLGSITSIKGIMDSLAKAQKDKTGSLLGSLSGGIGIAGAAIGIISGITKALTSVSQKEREQARYTYELQLKQTEAVTKALERQIAAIEEAYGVERIQKFNESLLSVKKTYDELNDSLNGKYTLSTDAELNKLIEMANAGANLPSFAKDVIKALVGSGQIQDLSKIAAGLDDITTSSKALNELQSLLDLGKLDDQTASVVSNLIKQAELFKETLNALKAETTGTTFNEIADSITSMFANATTSAEDWGKSFEEIIQKSILNGFKRDYLAKELQGFYDEFAEASKDNLTAQEIAIFEARYQQIISNGKTKFEELEKVTGVGFSQDKTPTALASGRITASLTEETASRTLGIWTGMYDVNKKQLYAIENLGSSIGDLFHLAKDNFNIYVKIEQNTANTVQRLDAAVTELKAINKNTSDKGRAL